MFHCYDLHNCSGNGECMGPNVCKCFPGYLVSLPVLKHRYEISSLLQKTSSGQLTERDRPLQRIHQVA